MEKVKYSEKLKDPRWQKKRLEILERDKWTCRACGEKDKTLHVHHIFYLPKKEPWDIPGGLLITFCERCHIPTCENGPCEKCADFDTDPTNLSRCEGMNNHGLEIVNLISNLLDIIWKDEGLLGGNDYNNALANAYFILKP